MREIGRRNDQLGDGYPVIRHEDHLQLVPRARIVVDHLGHVVDQTDDQFGHVIGRRRLATEDHRARRCVTVDTVQDVIVVGHDVQQVEELPLVFVNALDLYVEDAVRIEDDAGLALDVVGQTHLVAAFRSGKVVAELLVVGRRAQLLQAIQIEPPVLAEALVDQGRQTGVGLAQPATRRDSVGLVVETLGEKLGKIGKDGLHHQVGVQLRHPVHPMAADNRQVRHADALAVVGAITVVDQRQAADQVNITGEAQRHFLQEFLVDAEDDAHVTRQQVLEQAHRPGFQRFRHQRVVGVGENAAALTPGVGPQHAVHVAKQAHQFGDTDRRVRVVEVDGDLVCEIVERAMLFEVMKEDVLQGGRNEEIFLAQTQFAAGRRAVVRIQHPGDVFKAVLEFGSTGVVTGVEGVEVDLRRRIGLPQAQRADPLGAMTGNHVVVSIGLNGLGGIPLRPFTKMLGSTAEMHGEMRTGAAEFPDILLYQPVIRVLDLAAIDNRLGEHAVFVTHAIAPGG